MTDPIQAAFMRLKNFAPVLLSALVLAGLLAGCSDDPMMESSSLMPVSATPVDPDPAALRMARAAEQATAALDKLSQVEAFRTPMPADSGPALNTPAMMQPTTITWTGPIEQITRTLAEMGGFSFKTIGQAPPVALVVSVNAYQQPIGTILRDIGFQAGRRADVVVDLPTQTVNLRYAPTEGVIHY